jgi:hypothetical protein
MPSSSGREPFRWRVVPPVEAGTEASSVDLLDVSRGLFLQFWLVLLKDVLMGEPVWKRLGMPKDGLSETSSSMLIISELKDARCEGIALGGSIVPRPVRERSNAANCSSRPPSSWIGEATRGLPETLLSSSIADAVPMGAGASAIGSSLRGMISWRVCWFVTGSMRWTVLPENRRA